LTLQYSFSISTVLDRAGWGPDNTISAEQNFVIHPQLSPTPSAVVFCYIRPQKAHSIFPWPDKIFFSGFLQSHKMKIVKEHAII
jgi:hypothetical protein